MTLSRSSLLIAGLWAVSIVGTIQTAFLMPFPRSVEMSPATMVVMLAMPVLFFGVMASWMPHSPFYHPALARFIDARMGAQALESFLVRLKPLLMFATAGGLQGLAGLLHSYATGADVGAYATPGFMLSGGVGFALVHLVLYRRRAVGVFPVQTMQDAASRSSRSGPRRRSLRDALRVYWWTLIGVAVFPTAAVFGSELLDVGLEFLAIPFFVVGLLAAWPHLSGRAPYTFWLVATAVWLVGGVLAFVLFELLHLLGLR